MAVIVCDYDPIYDEDEDDSTKSRGKGSSVHVMSYNIVNYEHMPQFVGSIYKDGEPSFMGMGVGGNLKYGYEWLPPHEQITHWMYLPEAPDYDTVYNADKDHLEYVYKG
jgi:hypothetical protein